VQRFHRFLDLGVRVEAVDLVEIDVVGAQSMQRLVELLDDCPPGQPGTAWAVMHLEEPFVARTTSSRRVYFLTARPTISSEVPYP
jgi:hypothetical protein